MDRFYMARFYMGRFKNRVKALRDRARRAASPKRRLWSLQQDCPLLQKLPREIYLQITGMLDDISVLSLSLTCRTLYGVSFYEARSRINVPYEWPNRDMRRAFVQLLERDWPEWYYCDRCVRLHRWNGPSGTKHDPYRRDRPVYGCYANSLQWGGWPGPYSYATARMLLKRIYYGAPHGISLKEAKLNRRRTYIREEHGFRFQYSGTTEARIIDNSVMLRTKIVYKSFPGQAIYLNKFLTMNPVYICGLLECTLTQRSGFTVAGRIRPFVEYDPVHFASDRHPEQEAFPPPFSPGLHSCPHCTDYHMDVQWNGKDARWTISFTIYTIASAPAEDGSDIMSQWREGLEWAKKNGPGTLRDRWCRDSGEVDSVAMEENPWYYPVIWGQPP